MFNLFAHTGSLEGMVAIDQIQAVLAGLVLIILGLLGIIIYLVNTWQPKSFTAAKKSTVAAKKKTTKK